MSERKKGHRDLLDRVISRVMVTRPKSEEGGTFELVRTTKTIVSKVKYLLKTGIPSVDQILGGGLPFGRIIEPFGLESCGKTTFAKLCSIQLQKMEIYERIIDADDRTIELKKVDPDEIDIYIVFIDNEQSIDDNEEIYFYDPITDKKILIDMALGNCDTVDQMFKIMDRVLEEVEIIKAERKKEPFILFVVDTIAGTPSKEDIMAKWGTDDYPRAPKQLKTGFKKLVRQIRRRNLLMICTNQVGDNYAQRTKGRSMIPRASDFTSPGGKTLKFFSTIRIFMFPLEPYKLTSDSRFAAGIKVGLFTVKNRQVKPLREARAVLLFDQKQGGFHPAFSMLEQLIYLKFAEVNKTTGEIRFRFNRWKIPQTTFGSTADAGAELEADDDRGRVADPTIDSRSDWPSFYATHKVDFDAMWTKATDYLFTTEGLGSVEIPNDGDEDDDDDQNDFPEDRA